MSTEWVYITPDRVLVVPSRFSLGSYARLRQQSRSFRRGSHLLSFRCVAPQETSLDGDLVVDGGGMVRLSVAQYEALFPGARGRPSGNWAHGGHLLLVWDGQTLQMHRDPSTARVHRNGYVRIDPNALEYGDRDRPVVVSYVGGGVTMHPIEPEPAPSVVRRYGTSFLTSVLTRAGNGGGIAIPIDPAATKVLGDRPGPVHCRVEWGQALVSQVPFEGSAAAAARNVRTVHEPGVGLIVDGDYPYMQSTLYRFSQCQIGPDLDPPNTLVVSIAGDRVVLEPLAEMVRPRLIEQLADRLRQTSTSWGSASKELFKVRGYLYSHCAQGLRDARAELVKLEAVAPVGARQSIRDLIRDLPLHHDGLLYRAWESRSPMARVPPPLAPWLTPPRTAADHPHPEGHQVAAMRRVVAIGREPTPGDLAALKHGADSDDHAVAVAAAATKAGKSVRIVGRLGDDMRHIVEVHAEAARCDGPCCRGPS